MEEEKQGEESEEPITREESNSSVDEEGERFWKDEKKKSIIRKKPILIRQEKPEGKTKVNLDGEKIRNGLGQLVLTVIELLRELMEKQAIRRIEKGKLSEEQIERLGNNFKRLKEEIEGFKEFFELDDEDIGFDLGPVTLIEDEASGKASVVEILDRLLGKGIVVRGDVIISVADVDLIALNLGLLLASIDKASELYGTNTLKLKDEIERLKKENERLKKI